MQLVEKILGPGSGRGELPRIVAVDGRSGGGKTTLAARLQACIPNAAVVHTDDLGWDYSFFGWVDLLIEGVLRPVRANGVVDYRPPGWETHGRAGSIIVPAPCEVLIVEGVGASRLEVWPWLTASIWVQSDIDESQRRGIARDGDTEETRNLWAEWLREENVFLAAQQPWLRATAIVNGTPDIPHDPQHEVVCGEKSAFHGQE
jgi:uridine kinase